MSKEELKQLKELTEKLLKERLEEHKKQYPDFDEWEPEEQYEADDGDRLLEGCDIILGYCCRKV